MQWHYAKEGQLVGPITERDFTRLVRAGAIRADTLVWHDGMQAWTAYGQIPQEEAPLHARPRLRLASRPGGIVCSQCGRDFPPEHVAQVEGANVCVECNPALFPQLRSGVDQAGATGHGGFWSRMAAKLTRPTAAGSSDSSKRTP